MSKVARAALIAKLAHKGQKYGDDDYFIAHVNEVAYEVGFAPGSHPFHMEVAYLHDVLEDTELTEEDLYLLGVSVEVIETVKLLTKPLGVTYNDYIQKIIDSGNIGAMIVKYCDNKVNYQATGKESLKFRYTQSMMMIKPYLPQKELPF
jgi:(p)ppGpp synthase/HD superfamily hydrolase